MEEQKRAGGLTPEPGRLLERYKAQWTDEAGHLPVTVWPGPPEPAGGSWVDRHSWEYDDDVEEAIRNCTITRGANRSANAAPTKLAYPSRRPHWLTETRPFVFRSSRCLGAGRAYRDWEQTPFFNHPGLDEGHESDIVAIGAQTDNFASRLFEAGVEDATVA